MRAPAGRNVAGRLALFVAAALSGFAVPAGAQDASAEASVDSNDYDLGDPSARNWRVYAGGYGGWSAMDVTSVVRDGDVARFRSLGMNRNGPVEVDGLVADFYVLDRAYDCSGRTQWSEAVRFFNFDGTLLLTKPLDPNPRPLTGSEAGHYIPIACNGEEIAAETSLDLFIKTGRDWHSAAAGIE